MSVFILLIFFSPAISYFYSFYHPPSTRSLPLPSWWLMELGNSTQSNVWPTVQDSLRERERERLVRRRRGWGLNEKRGERKGRKEEAGSQWVCEREGEGGRGRGVYERKRKREGERGAQLKATDLILCIIKQSHSMQHPLYIIHAQ